MSQARDEAGNIWDTSTNPPTLVQAAAATPSAIQLSGPDPSLSLDRAGKALSNERTQRDLIQSAQTAPYAVREAAAKADRAEIEARQAGRDAGSVDPRRKVQFEQAGKLRNDYLSLPSVKNYTQALPVYAAGLRSGADSAGDLNLIYAYAKVMDPNSVVREGEQASVAGGDTWINQKTAQLQKQLGNGGTFKPEFRTRLRQEMAGRMGELNQQFIADRVNFKQTADRYGIDPRDVVGAHPGARYQALSEKVLGRQQQQLDYDGNPIGGIASGKTRPVPDPETSGKIDALIRAGVSPEAALRAIPDLKIDQYVAAQKYAKAHPEYRGGYGAALKQVLLTLQQRAAGSGIGTGVGAAVDAALGGSVDEIAGGVNSLVNGTSWADETRKLNDAKQAAFTQHPVAAPIGQVVGTIGAMTGLGMAAKGLGIGSGLANPALAADIGFGTASGALQNNDARLVGAAGGGLGAFAGNLAGTAISAPLGALARTQQGLALINRARAATGRLPPVAPANAPSVVERTLAGVLDRAKAPNVTANLAEAQAQNLPFTLADASPSLGELAGASARRSPVTRDLAESTLLSRSRGQIDRFGQSVERNLGPTANIPQLSADLTQQARTAAGPLYDAAYAAPGASSVDLSDLASRPLSMKPGLARARTIAQEEGRDPTSLGFDLNDQGEVVLTRVPSFQTIDYVKRGLDDVLEPHRDPITGKLALNEATRAINATKNDLLTRTDAVNPAYAQARAAYAGPVQARDALARGRDALSLDPNDLRMQIAAQTPEHVDQMQLGYRSGLMDQANRVRYSSNPFDATLGTPAAEQRLTALFPDNPGVTAMLRQRDLERTMAQTATRVVGGSQTAGREVADQAFAASPLLEGALHAGAAVATGGASLPATFGRIAASGLKDRAALGFGRAAESKAEQLGPMLLNTDPQASIAMINDLLAKTAAWKALVDATRPRASLSRLGAAAGSNAGIQFAR